MASPRALAGRRCSRRDHRRPLPVLLAVGLVLVLAVLVPAVFVSGAAGAQEAPVTPGADAGAPAAPTPAPAPVDAGAAADGPHPVGHALPSKKQRVLDSLILVGLLVGLFVALPAGAWWVHRRRVAGPGAPPAP